MSRLSRILPVATTVLLAASQAKTPQQLKTDLAGILPAGKKARLAWSHGGQVRDYRSGDKIYVVDSDDGIVRELVPGKFQGQIAGRLYHPHITYDGNRVILTEQGSLTMWVINWDGTGLKRFASGYGSDYYYDAATKTDWVVRNDNSSYTSNLKRVNIDNTTQSVVLWNKTGYRGDADDGIGLSSDGLYFATYFFYNNNGGLPGVARIPDGAITLATDASSNRGCVLSIAPDNHDFMHQQIPHVKVQFYSGTDGRKINEYDITTPIITWAQQNGKRNGCSSVNEHQATRWCSTDRNYITANMEFTSVNPFIFRLSDMKWIYIKDSTNCLTAGDMDMRIATSWGATSVESVSAKFPRRATAARNEIFGIDGRRLGAAARTHRGVAIRKRDLNGIGEAAITVMR